MSESIQPERELASIKHALDLAAIVAITDRSGKIIHVNDKFCEISGFPREELIGKTHRIINSGYHPKDFFVSMWRKISRGEVWEGEVRNRAKDGTYYWVHTTIVPFLDDDGVPYQYVSIRFEITARKEAEAKLQTSAARLERSNDELREREERVRSLFDATFEGIYVHREDGTLLDVNVTGARILGSPATELLGKNLPALLGKDKPITAGSGVSTYRWDRPSGGSVHLELSSKPYTHAGEKVVLTACRDVTERMQMQAQIVQQDRLASVGLLASSLAHEIGTPLGVIRGRAEYLALKAKDNELVSEMSSIIISQIDRVSQLIRSLLALARGGEATNDVGTVAVRTVVDEVVSLLQHEFRKASVDVRIDVPESVCVQAASGPLHQVLLNLLVNSVHAIQEARTSQGRTEEAHFVQIEASRQGDRVRVAVSDSGCGISEAHMAKLFTPFFTTKDIGKGTGLGLATSFRIVEDWGGKMSAKSQLRKGTTFVLDLVPV